MATKKQTTITRYVQPKVAKADYEALQKKLVTLRKRTAEAAASQETRAISYVTAIGTTLYEAKQATLPAVMGVEGKLAIGLLAVGVGEFGLKGEWGERLAAAGDALAILGFGEAARRGTPFV